MITYVLRQNKLKTNIKCYLKWYAYPVSHTPVDMTGLAEHMANHNTPYSQGTIMGILTDMVTCIKELLLDGKSVRIDNLAVFSVGIKNKKGCEDPTNYRASEYVDTVKMRALAIGELSKTQLNLDASLKRSSLDASSKVTSDVEDEDDGPLPDAQE